MTLTDLASYVFFWLPKLAANDKLHFADRAEKSRFNHCMNQ